MIKNQRFLAYKVSPYDLPEIEASLDTAKLVLPTSLTDLFLMKLVWEDLQLLLLAATSEEWKNWSTMLMVSVMEYYSTYSINHTSII